ncbi:phage portal protein [Pseudactinotalea suaedae]|uniref:phage portal protein n=1 Tax=Pseudactinotalea suaedae TaxID=1524924 RepID=UPI0012E2C640|nr:phage portal protein [Pseudactinotalea suaedae]
MKALDGLSTLLRGNMILASSLENPATPLTGGRLLSQLDDPGELWSDGDTTRDSNPMKVGTALRCVQIISSSVAGCPLHVTAKGSYEHLHIPALAHEYDGGQTTPFETWETVVAHLALWGNAYVRKIRARDGRIIALQPIHPARVKVEIDDDETALRIAVGLPYVRRFKIDGGFQSGGDELTAYEVMHIPNLSLDGVKGYSVIGNMRRTFGLATKAEKLAEKMFGQGLLMQGYLSTENELGQEKVEILKDRWRAKVAGIDNAFDVPVFDKGLKFTQLTMSPEDAQFLESRKFQTTEIARLFGVPGWMVNDQEKSTSWGSGMEQQFIAFVVVTLKHYFHRIEQRVTREIVDPKTERAKFALEGLLRGDTKSRAAFYASGIVNGWLTPNDVRDLEDKPRVEWGDEPYRPYTGSEQPMDDDTAAGDEDEDDDAQ